MTNRRRDAERRADEGACHFGEFLARVKRRTERARLVTIETRSMTSAMTELVEDRSKPIDRFEICVNRGNLHVIESGMIERFTAADANIGAGRRYHCVRARNDRLRRQRRRGIAGQPFALVGIEEREALRVSFGAAIVLFSRTDGQETFSLSFIPSLIFRPPLPLASGHLRRTAIGSGRFRLRLGLSRRAISRSTSSSCRSRTSVGTRLAFRSRSLRRTSRAAPFCKASAFAPFSTKRARKRACSRSPRAAAAIVLWNCW